MPSMTKKTLRNSNPSIFMERSIALEIKILEINPLFSSPRYWFWIDRIYCYAKLSIVISLHIQRTDDILTLKQWKYCYINLLNVKNLTKKMKHAYEFITNLRKGIINKVWDLSYQSSFVFEIVYVCEWYIRFWNHIIYVHQYHYGISLLFIDVKTSSKGFANAIISQLY